MIEHNSYVKNAIKRIVKRDGRSDTDSIIERGSLSEQQQLSLAYSDLKDKHVRLQLIIKALKKEIAELKEECKKYGRMYWEAKDELNNLIRGRECPQEETL